MSSAKLQLAVIGCGSATQILHLPALARTEEIEVCALVDRDEARAQRLGQIYGIPNILTDYNALTQAQAALVALPNHLHAPVTQDLLRRGLHVCVENPMALTVADCEQMIQVAAETRKTLAMGMIRRGFPAIRFVHDALVTNLIGPVTSVDWQEGHNAGWETASDYILRPEQAGGGILTDLGPQIIDTLTWWFGQPKLIEYADDAQGGLEANCLATLELPGGIPARVELSRGRRLPNRVRIQGRNARLILSVGPGGPVSLEFDSPGPNKLSGFPGTASQATEHDALRLLFSDFARSIAESRKPWVTGEAGRDTVALIQNCYAQRTLLRYPWEVNAA